MNHFNNRRDLEFHGLLNGLPALILFVAAFASYYLLTTRITIGLVSVGVLWLILFAVITYLYSNARLYVTEGGLVLRKGKREQMFKWEEIKTLEFLAMKGGTEPTIPPIKLSIVKNGDEGEETTIYLYKNRFRTPLFNYYKLLGLIGCIPQARKLLPDKLEKLNA